MSTLKRCRCCNKQYSLVSFLSLPIPKYGNISFFKDKEGICITVFRDCSCGSTIAILLESK